MIDYKNKFSEFTYLAAKRQNVVRDVDSDLVSVAKEIIGKPLYSTIDDSFLFFSAVNYLNFAVKKDKSLGYSFKSKLENALSYLSRHPLPGVMMSASIDKGMPILYVSFYGFVYSFHCVSISDSALLKYLSNNPQISFDGVKKQPCADELLIAAIENPNVSFRPSLKNDGVIVNRKTSIDSQPANGGFNPEKRNACGSYKISFDFDDFSLEYFIEGFHLRKLTTNESMCRNIAIVIASLYLNRDLVSSSKPSLPIFLKKCLFREMITQSYSIIEALELELGAMILGENSDTTGLSSSERVKKQEREKKAYASRLDMPVKTKNILDEFRKLRNNVHLSKMQSIDNDPNYVETKVEYFINFMQEYVEYMYTDFNNIVRKRK